jgi:hypothetical protein
MLEQQDEHLNIWMKKQTIIDALENSMLAEAGWWWCRNRIG